MAFQSNALPGIVSFFYEGWTSPFKEIVELGEDDTIPYHRVGPAERVVTPVYEDGRWIADLITYEGPKEPDPIPPGTYYLTVQDQEILKSIYGDFPLGVADSTVGPGIVPDDISTEQLVFRLESLVEEAQGLGWIGSEAAEKLSDRARAARRKVSLGEGHARAAWAKLLSFRDELRDAHDEWIKAHEDESRDRASEHRVRGRREDALIPFIPEYDDSPIDEDAADDRAWALLEPNVRYLLDRLSPPAPPEQGRGPGIPRDEERDR